MRAARFTPLMWSLHLCPALLLGASILSTGCSDRLQRERGNAFRIPARPMYHEILNAPEPLNPSPIRPSLLTRDASAMGLDASRKLVRTVDLDLVVRDPEIASRDAQKLVVASGGYVATVDSRREAGLPFCDLTVRIPVDHLEAALVSFRKLAQRL